MYEAGSLRWPRGPASFRWLGVVVVVVVLAASGGLWCARLAQIGSVSGQVQDAHGTPLQGIEVRARPLELYHHGSDQVIQPRDRERVVLTDREGRYRIRGLVKEVSLGWRGGRLQQDYELVAAGAGMAPLQARIHVRDGSVRGLDFVLEREGSLAGRIVDTLGRPCAGREVGLLRDGWIGDKAFVVQCALPRRYQRTDADGRFGYKRLSPGRYSVEVVVYLHGSVIAQRAGRSPVELRPGESVAGIDFPIEAPEVWGRVSGLVVDDVTGDAVPEFSLRVVKIEGEGSIGPLWGRYDRDGSWIPFADYGPYHEPPIFVGNNFRVADISPGIVTLEVSAPGHVVTQQRVPVIAGGSTNVVVRMARESAIVGRVKHQGRVAAGAPLLLYRAEVVGGEPECLIAGLKGDYAFRRLRAGHYLLQAEVVKQEGEPTIRRMDWAEVEVGAQETAEVDFDLGMGDSLGGLAVHLRGVGQSRLPFVRVEEEGSARGLAGIPRVRAVAYRLKGPAQISGLPAGRYVIRAQARPRDENQASLSVLERTKTVTLVPGQVARLEFDFR